MADIVGIPKQDASDLRKALLALWFMAKAALVVPESDEEYQARIDRMCGRR